MTTFLPFGGTHLLNGPLVNCIISHTRIVKHFGPRAHARHNLMSSGPSKLVGYRKGATVR